MASALFPVAQNAAVGFPTIPYWRNSVILSVPFAKWTPVNLWVLGIIFAYIPLFYCPRFLTGAPLVTNCSYCWFYTFRRFEIYRIWFLHGWTLLGNVSSKIGGSHWGNHWIQLGFIYSVLFSRLCWILQYLRHRQSCCPPAQESRTPGRRPSSCQQLKWIRRNRYEVNNTAIRRKYA